MKWKKIISVIAAAAVMTGTVASAAVTDVQTKYPFGTLTRRMEELDRGLVAVKTYGGIYLSWRLMSGEDNIFGSARNNVTFDIYRDNEKIATEEYTTNYIDPDGTSDSEYYVESSEGDRSETVTALSSGSNYFDIPLVKPNTETITTPSNERVGTFSFSPADCSVGDLDGDGEYEIIVKWTSSEHDVGSPGTGNDSYSGTVRFAAYKLNGTKLWENDINLGRNVYSSAHTAQFLVYDFDGDGKSEMMVQTSLGSTDGTGEYVSHAAKNDEEISGITDEENAAADFRPETGWGIITTGAEFLTVFDGETGAAIDTIDFPTARIGNGESFGDTSGNRSNRFTADVAYLDGEKPYAVYLRGYYFGRNGQQRTGISGISFDGEALSVDYRFDTLKGQPGYYDGAEIYVGNGNHNCTVADVDGDGRDEFITGALCMEVDDNNDFKPRWCTFMEHGDALHIGDYDPTHDGYEFFTVHEDSGPNTMSGSVVNINYGMSVIDADTGEIMFHANGSDDTGRGLMANIGAGGYYQLTSSRAGSYRADGGTEFTPGDFGMSMNFRVFWDGDLYDELLDGTDITDWNGTGMSRIFQAVGCVKINGTKSNPAVQADLFGDWREEVVYPTRDGSALRVFTTTIPTEYKMMTLMHDSVYRSGVAAEQTAYNQPPHIGFYTDDTIFNGPITELKIIAPPDKTEYNVGDALDPTGLTVSIVYESGKTVETTNYTIDGYDPYSAGSQTVTLTCGDVSNSFDVTVLSGFTADADGIITGYDKNATGETTVILPQKINGTAVKGFADGSMKDSGVEKLYIYDSELTFDGDVFDSTVTVFGEAESTAQAYCEEHGIPFVTTAVNFTYVADENYDSDTFDGYAGTLNLEDGIFGGNFIVTQSGTLATKTINGIIYGDNPRADAYPDSTTGIKVGKDTAGNKYLVPIAGEFSTGGRNAWLETEEKIAFADTSEYTFKFDILYPAKCGTLVLTLSDGTNTVDTIQLTSDMQTDTWYTYTYHYDTDKRLTRTLSSGGSVIEEKDMGISAGEYGICKIDFTRSDGGPNPSELWGGWGNHGMGRTALAYMDNIQVFTPERTAANFTVTDDYGCPVEGAVVSMADKSEITDAEGKASIEVENGKYTAMVSADGYDSKVLEVVLKDGSVAVEVELNALPVTAESITLENPSVTLTKGGYALLRYSVSPGTADFGLTFTSSDESVARVDENSVITGVAPGTAQITVSRDDATASCTATVLEESDGAPAAVVIRGDDTYTPNPWTGGGSVSVSASVYDGNGVELFDTPVEFSYSGASGAESRYNSVTLTPDGSGDITVTAKAGGASAEKTITIEKSSAAENAFSSFDTSASLLQDRTEQSMQLDGTGITLNVGGRGGGGDRFSGFVIADGKLRAQAGQFSTANRNAYITFDKPAAIADGEFMLETKINFAKGSEAMLNIGDGKNTIVTITPTSLGLEREKDYIYRLYYSGGKYIQTVTDMDNAQVSSSEIESPASGISRIDILFSDAQNAAVTFDDMRLVSTTGKIMARAVVYVCDENGSPIEGAAVSTAIDSAVTAANGRAALNCYSGINAFTVSYNGMTAVKTADTDGRTVSVKLSDGSVKLLGGEKAVYMVKNTDYVQFVNAVYDGGLLDKADISHVYFPAGINLIEIPDGGRVFAWDSNMKPFTEVFGN